MSTARWDALLAAGVALLLMAVLGPMARLGVDPHHDGVMLKPALDVLSGQTLFRDSFMQYGALSSYLQAAALRVQPTLLALRLQAVAVYGVTLFFLFAAWRMFLPRSLCLVAGGLFILFVPAYEKGLGSEDFWLLLPWSSAFAMMFQAIAVYALFRVIRDEQPRRWGLILGLASACVFWCRQPVGVMMTGSLIVIWPALLRAGWAPVSRSAREIGLWIAGGFVAVNAVLLGQILLTGAFPAFWYQNIVWPGKWSASIDWSDTLRDYLHFPAGAALLGLGLVAAAPRLVRRFPALRSRSVLVGCGSGFVALLVWQHVRLREDLALREGGWSVLFPLLMLGQALVSVRLAFAPKPSPKTTEYYLVAALTGVALGSLLQYFPVADPWHAFYALAPAFGLVVFVFWRGLAWSAPVLAVGLAVLFLPAVYGKVVAARECLARPRITLTKPAVLRGMKVPAAQARFFGQVADTMDQILRHAPDLPCAMIGNDALFLCFGANQTNATPYYVTWRGLAENQDNLDRWAGIRRIRPLMILHRARWEAVSEFYRKDHYVPLLRVSAEEMEIAVPAELAAAMHRTAYDAVSVDGVASGTRQP